MKTNKFFIALALFAIVFSACKKEEDPNDQDNNNTEKELKFTLEVIDNTGTGTLGLGYNCQILTDAEGTLHTVYTDRDNFTVKYAYKTSGGTWTISDIASNASGSLSTLTIDNAGNLHVVYETGSPENKLFHAIKTAGGSTWTINPFGLTGYYLASTDTYMNMVCDSNNGLHLVAKNSGGDNYLLYFYKPESGSWTMEIMDNRQGCGEQPSIAIKDNVIHVAYGDDGTNGKLFYATKTVGSDTWSKESVTSSTAIYYTSIAINSLNEIRIVYRDYAGGYKCAIKSSGSWSTELIDETYGVTPGLDSDQDNIFYSSYSYDGGTGLKLAYKTSESSWTKLMLDDTDGFNYVQYTDLFCSSNGHTYIVYQVANGGSGRNLLKLADVYWE